MSVAKYRKVYGKHGSGRFTVSEGIDPGCNFGPVKLPEMATPSLPDDDRFEIVINPGPLFIEVDGKFVPIEENDDQPQPDNGEYEDE